VDNTPLLADVRARLIPIATVAIHVKPGGSDDEKAYSVLPLFHSFSCLCDEWLWAESISHFCP
jgi:hypothetical protein